MKKILALIICLIMIISSCLLTGCFDDIDDSTSNATSESTSENADANKVSLLGIQASVHEGALPQSAQNSPAASLLSTYTTTPEIQTMSNTHSGDELLENDGGYLSIFKTQTIINFTIKLNNPYDYYILDFRLGADDEEVEYYTSEKTWKSIADRDDCVYSYEEDKFIYTDYDIKEDGVYDDVRFRYIDYSYTEKNVTIKMKKVYFMRDEKFTIRYFEDYKPTIITKETFDEETQETKTKRYYAMEMMFEGFGCPLNPAYVVWNMTYKGNNFIYEWNGPRLLLEVPDGKDEAWCREQEFEIFGNVFNVGRLADGKYGRYAIARD